jgi:hypothetical protein
MPEKRGEKDGADNWSFGRSGLGVCDSLFSAANLRKACKIVCVDTGHAAVFIGSCSAGSINLMSIVPDGFDASGPGHHWYNAYHGTIFHADRDT